MIFIFKIFGHFSDDEWEEEKEILKYWCRYATSIIWFRNLSSTAAGWTYQLFSKVEKHLFCQRQNLLSKSYKLLFSILLLLPCIVRKLWEENFNQIVENRKIRYLVRSVLMLVNIFGAQILLMINLTYFWLMMQLICPLQIYATLLCGYKSGTDIRSPNYIPPVVDEKVQSLAWRIFSYVKLAWPVRIIKFSPKKVLCILGFII